MIPPLSGTYALILKADVTRELIVGKIGSVRIHPGFYVYAGSAMGPGGLGARVGRHMKKRKKRHWHIDHLRRHMEIIEIWYAVSEMKQECRWADFLSCFGGLSTRPGLGASDCKCGSHLFYFEKMPLFSGFATKISVPVFCKILKP